MFKRFLVIVENDIREEAFRELDRSDSPVPFVSIHGFSIANLDSIFRIKSRRWMGVTRVGVCQSLVIVFVKSILIYNNIYVRWFWIVNVDIISSDS